jgi:pSer/pThr/pTyr-binding forkhead associated (FHA) protein
MPSRFIVGRAPGCELRLTDPRVSGEHAAIYFEEGHWRIRDLASSNGTRLNGEPIQPGTRHALLRGDTIIFGSSVETWELVDDQAPSEEGIRETAPVAVTMSQVTLEFYVGPAAPDLEVLLVTPRSKHVLPERACHHLLLALARAREADLAQGLAEKDCGWMQAEDLTPSPFHDVVTVTLNIHRARKQLEGFGVDGAHGLIQRRKGRRIRLGVRSFKIEAAPGSTMGPPAGRSTPPEES